MDCPKCGTPNADNAQFCLNCGETLAPSPASARPPAYQAAPTAPAYPATPAGGVRTLGYIVAGLSLLILLGFFVMAWIPRVSLGYGSTIGTGGDIYYQVILKNLGAAFEALGQAISVSFWLFLAMLSMILWFLIPVGAIITGIRGILLIATPEKAWNVRRKITGWSLTSALVMLVFIISAALLGVQAGAAVSLSGVQYGFWITLLASIALYVVGLAVAPRLVAGDQL